jgi:predicted membrane protein
MVQPQGRPGRFWGLILTFAGAALLLDKLYFLSFSLWDFWPLMIVAIGLSMIWRSSTRRRHYSREWPTSVDSDSTLSGTAIMSGFRRTSNSQDFRGGELTAIMGGCEVDLREASIKDGEAIIDVFAFWGGIELKVPTDWSVVVMGSPLMGGFDDKTRSPQGGSTKRLIIKGYAIMGGVEISN